MLKWEIKWMYNSYYITSKQLSVTSIRSITQRTIEQLLQLNTESMRNFKQWVFGLACQGAGYHRSLSVSTEVIYWLVRMALKRQRWIKKVYSAFYQTLSVAKTQNCFRLSITIIGSSPASLWHYTARGETQARWFKTLQMPPIGVIKVLLKWTWLLLTNSISPPLF